MTNAPAPRARSLGLVSLTALGLNTIIGSGIFRLPSELAASWGAFSPLAFLFGGALLICVALCFAEVGSRFERDGGVYLYARAAFGAWPGFMVGWTAWAGAIFTLAAVAVALPSQLGEFVPQMADPTSAKLVSLAAIAVLALLNAGDVRVGASASNVLAVFKLAALLAFVATGIFVVTAGSLDGSVAPAAFHFDASTVGSVVLPTFFVLSGFETAAVPGTETRNPSKTIPRAVLGSLILAAIFYTLIQYVVVRTLPDAATSARPLADAARIIVGNWGARAIALVGFASILGLCASMCFAAPRFLFALSDDGFLPLPKKKSATVFGSALFAAGLVVFADFKSLVDFTAVTLVFQYMATCLSVPVLRRRMGPAPVSIPTAPVFALIGSGLLLFVVSHTSPLELVVSACVIALGIALSFAYKASHGKNLA